MLAANRNSWLMNRHIYAVIILDTRGETHIWGVDMMHFCVFFLNTGFSEGDLGSWGNPQEIAGND